MQSKILAKIQDIKHELALSRHQKIDPKRHRYLTARLQQLENEAGAFSFNEQERESGEINIGDKPIVSKTYYVPLPSWTISTDTDKKS